jgi:hypothetical protein
MFTPASMGNSSTISWRRSDFVCCQGEILPQLATKAVAATGTEHQPVVAGALAIADLTAVFAEGFAGRRPISSHSASDSGSVAMIRLCTGSWYWPKGGSVVA